MPSVFRDARWLRRDLLGVLDFYHPTVLDTRFGGYVSQVSDRDGAVYDARTKHLVPACRFVFDFSVGALVDGPHWCRPAAEHGLSFLTHVARDADTAGASDDGAGGYPWVLEGRSVRDATRSTYGHAFVLLAYATAARAGIGDAAARVAPTADLLDEHFWEPDHGAYRSDLDADWEPVEPYRGQNANMHATEALLAAYTQAAAVDQPALSVRRTAQHYYLPAIPLPPPHHQLMQRLGQPTEQGWQIDEQGWPLARQIYTRLGITLEEPET